MLPYCEIRPAHASYAMIDTKFKQARKSESHEADLNTDAVQRGRCEPAQLIQVAEVICKLQQRASDQSQTPLDIYSMSRQVELNVDQLFFGNIAQQQSQSQILRQMSQSWSRRIASLRINSSSDLGSLSSFESACKAAPNGMHALCVVCAAKPQCVVEM